MVDQGLNWNWTHNDLCPRILGSIPTGDTCFAEIILLFLRKQSKNDNIVNFTFDGKT